MIGILSGYFSEVHCAPMHRRYTTGFCGMDRRFRLYGVVVKTARLATRLQPELSLEWLRGPSPAATPMMAMGCTP